MPPVLYPVGLSHDTRTSLSSQDVAGEHLRVCWRVCNLGLPRPTPIPFKFRDLSVVFPVVEAAAYCGCGRRLLFPKTNKKPRHLHQFSLYTQFGTQRAFLLQCSSGCGLVGSCCSYFLQLLNLLKPISTSAGDYYLMVRFFCTR